MAINPLPFLQNMPDPGQAFLQSFQAARQQRDKVAQEQSRQQQYAQAIQGLMQDRSPEAMAQFALRFPEQGKAVQEVFANLSDEQKKSRFSQANTALQILESGDVEGAKRYGQEILQAAKNTRGQEDYAKALEFNLDMIDKNPDAAKLGLANSSYFLDPDAYKELYAKDDMKLDTSTIKNLVAEMGPEAIGTPEFKQALREERTKITTTLPGGGFFSGQADELNRILGGAPMPSNVQRGPIPSPKSKAEFDALRPGTMFKDPNGVVRTKPGGGSSNATGGFRTEGDSR